MQRPGGGCSLCTKPTTPRAGWQFAKRTGVLSDPGLLSLGEAAAEEADSEDHVMLPGVSGYQRSP